MVQAGRATSSTEPHVDQQHVGAGVLRELRRVRFNRQQLFSFFAAIHRFSKVCRICRRGAERLSAAQFYSDTATTPYIRQVDVFGGYTARGTISLHRAVLPASTGTASPSCSHRAHRRPRGSARPASRPATAGNPPAGSEKLAVRAGRTHRACIFKLQLHRAHNPTPPGYQNGEGQRLRAATAPHHSRGRDRAGHTRDAGGLRASAMAWGLLDVLGAQQKSSGAARAAPLVERGQKDVVPQPRPCRNCARHDVRRGRGRKLRRVMLGRRLRR